jgi:hypothetical protein
MSVNVTRVERGSFGRVKVRGGEGGVYVRGGSRSEVFDAGVVPVAGPWGEFGNVDFGVSVVDLWFSDVGVSVGLV